MKITVEQNADAGSKTLYMTIVVTDAAPSLNFKQILNYELPNISDPVISQTSRYGQTVKLTINRTDLKHTAESLASILIEANNALVAQFPAISHTYTKKV